MISRKVFWEKKVNDLLHKMQEKANNGIMYENFGQKEAEKLEKSFRNDKALSYQDYGYLSRLSQQVSVITKQFPN